MHPRPWLTPLCYTTFRTLSRTIAVITVRAKILHAPPTKTPFILAPTHLSHLEPFLLSTLLDRPIDWMSRIEFYQRRWSRRFLDHVGAFPVRRFGVPVGAIRTAIGRLHAGHTIGIFPEGGVAIGPDSVCRGGPIKRGVCLIACRAAVPVVPCVVLGTHRLNQVGPWIPWGRAKLWIAFGQPIEADRSLPSRPAREAMAKQIESSYRALFRELIDAFELDELRIP